MNKILQQNTDLELSVLAACILNTNTSKIASEILRPDIFYKQAHQEIFQKIIELVAENKKTDLVNISLSLKKTNSFVSATDVSRIIENPLSTNIEDHCKELIELYMRRKITIASNILHQSSFENNFSGEILEKFNKDMDSIGIIGTEKTETFESGFINVIEKIEERSKSGLEYFGLKTGFKKLDNVLGGFQDSDLIIIGARPSQGKTALALNIASNIAREGEPVLIFSYEMSKEQLIMREIVSSLKINSKFFKTGNLSQQNWRDINNEGGSPHYKKMIGIDKPLDLLSLGATARRLKREKNISCIIIDYLQLMPKPKAERNDLAVGIITGYLKSLAKELNIPVVLLSQLNRALEQRTNRRPIMSDLRHSGDIEQDADVIMFIYRDEYYNKEPDNPQKGIAEIDIAKHRNGETGTVKLLFLGYCTKFEHYDYY